MAQKTQRSVDTDDQQVRREAIRRLIRTKLVGTQEELRELLANEGFDVTQATLSRDLARLGARRATLPTGGSAYELDGASPQLPPGQDGLVQVRLMIASVDHSETLVVVHTLPGAASPVALAIDRARMPEVMGTIAGDDTIFVAPARGTSSARVAQRLRSLWMKGE